MRIIKFSTLLIVLFLTLFPLITAKAADDYCIWSPIVNSSPKAGEDICNLPGTQYFLFDSSGSSCAGKTKSAMDKICCCQIKERPGQCFMSNSCPSGQVCVDNWCQDNAGTTDAAKFKIPELQIEIPGLAKFSQVKCTADGKCGVPWIGEYINGIYNYAMSIAGILAAIILMAGGVLWLISGGDASKITQAKELIISSITGLIILAASYIILFQINPGLVNFTPIYIDQIKPIVLDTENTEPIPVDTGSISSILGVTCGKDSVSTIFSKAKGKVTYENQNRGTTGPNGTVYHDCSGFANFVIKCAFNKSAGASTAVIFQDQQEWDFDINSLKPGDLIGWPPENSVSGHTVVYLGGSTFGDCHGGAAGREPGGCISNSISVDSLKKSADKYSGGKLYFKRY